MKRKKFIYKVIALYLAFTILFDAVWPASAYALTSGPSQPEVQSFEPVGTSDMVDPFTGDFNYNIPLMTVPGPNGGYPINIAYHAGITMEQEASWVGLGWNLNVGALNRQMRGLPDDYSGETVKKTVSTKPSVTVGRAIGGIRGGSMSLVPVEEILGYVINDIPIPVNSGMFSFSQQVYYNNYKGVGIGFDITLNGSMTKETINGDKFSGLGAGLSFSLDPQNGAGVQPSFSLGSELFGKNTMFNAEFGYNTREGIYKLGLSTSSHVLEDRKSYGGSSLSYSGSSYIPANIIPTIGLSFNFYYKKGIGNSGNYSSYNSRLFGSWSDVKDETMELPGYGYLYSERPISIENGSGQEKRNNMLMDFNRENEGPITKESPYLAVPVFTNDVYSATGQGMGLNFRAYRDDIGVVHDPRSSSDNVQVLVGLENASHMGVNLQAGYTRAYSGRWNEVDNSTNNNWGEINGTYEFGNDNILKQDQFYFRAPGEMVASNSETERFSGNDPSNFNVKMAWAPEGALLSFKPKVQNARKSDGLPLLTYNARNEKDRRINNVEYYTLEQLSHNTIQPKNYVIDNANTFPGRDLVVAGSIDYTTNLSGYGIKNEQIGSYTILGSDGARYEYALPVYNSKQKEVVFAVPEQNLTYHTTPYSTSDAGTSNSNGIDHYYSATELPGYSYTNLLTAIYSADYVDLTGDGPSKDDLGYWVKFNYTKQAESYKWRTPFKDANYDKGFHSNGLDDKASYAYGEKEIWYLNSVETKTHIAEFHLSEREDGFGAADEYQNTNALGEAQMKLDRIELYAKADREKVIKTVNFAYDYQLCKGVPNNSSNTTLDPYAAGKLTLQKIWFTYLNNKKGKLTPYEFYYREDIDAYNPKYNILQMDRWGYYKPDRAVISTLDVNEDNPYVDQTNRTQVDEYMSAWNLYQVSLPSGGVITVDYEADDYAYVQDQRATQMFRIVKTGNEDHHGSGENKLYSNDGNGEIYDRVYFNLEKPTSDAAELQEYIKEVKQMYFKTYQHLKKYQDASGDWNEGYDYVDGFCEVLSIDFDPDALTDGLYTRAYVTLKPVTVLQGSDNRGTTHPFSKAAWQYMKIKRPDLLYQSMPVNEDVSPLENIGAQLSSIGVSYFRNVVQLILGYYTSCRTLGYASDLDLSVSFHPSFIRLNSPDKIKVGGGHRVKSIRLSDKWNTLLTEDGQPSPEASFDDYGIEYSYHSLDGSSSGVASYEPLIGGEENALRLPTDYYSADRRFLYNTKDFYLVKPIGESYYPGAMVGYSRVTVKNLKQDVSEIEINKSTSPGITVMEFYTSRDFPVRVDNTTIADCHYAPSVNIPFVGSFSYNNHGYSQGYTVWLNDMNGKLKSVSTYASQVDTDNESMDSKYETRTLYVYNQQGNYNKEGGNKLLNLVNIMDREGDYRFGLLGQSTEFFMDMAQHSGFTVGIGAQFNVDPVPPATVPSSYPMLDYNEQMFRSVVTMKIVTQNGILKEVITTKNGSTALAQNLMFDGYTGAVVLSSLTNEHDEPVYNYSYAAHWNYDKMGGAYKNYGFKIPDWVTINGANQYVMPSGITATQYFNVGDMIELYSGTYNTYFNCWVEDVDAGANAIVLIDENGAHLPASTTVTSLRIVKSVRTNQLSAGSGSIVSLSNPVTGRNFPLLAAFNTLLENESALSSVSFTDCSTGEERTANITINAGSIVFSVPDQCSGTITLPSGFAALDAENIYQYRFYKRGSHILITRPETESTTYLETIGTWTDIENCFPECLDNVLHADAVRLHDDWLYDYTDLGNPTVTARGLAGTTTPALSAAATSTPYRFGKTGIWNPFCNYVYQIDRKQAIPEDGVGNVTNTRRDGVYENFTLYNWSSDNAGNKDWTYVSQISKYSHFGFELENRDVLGHYSSALYGYNNSVVTAVQANASYYEAGFDGFEDYLSNTYTTPGHGHLNLLYQSSSTVPVITSSDAHTGKSSVELSSAIAYSGIPTVAQDPYTLDVADQPQTAFSFVQNRKYVATAWFKSAVSSAVPSISVTNATVVSTNVMPQKIEGWQRVEIVFTPNSSSAVSITFSYTGGNGDELIDDIRIQPFTSMMTTYVYDPLTLWLVAELDNRNFATYYNYDEEGALIQVKKETEKGIATLKTSRNNIHQQPE